MKNLILGSFLAGLALFFWGFIYYGISGIPYKTLETPAATVPAALVHIRPEGVGSLGTMMGTGFVHGVVYCFLLALILQQICKKSGYGERVWFVTQVGMAGAFAARFGDAIWFWQSWSWKISNFVYSAISAAIAGAILAKFIKSPVKS